MREQRMVERQRRLTFYRQGDPNCAQAARSPRDSVVFHRGGTYNMPLIPERTARGRVVAKI